MKETYYKEQLSEIYKKHFKYSTIIIDPILNEFVKLAQKANDDQNKRNAFLNYQKTEKGKESQHQRYFNRKNKECAEPFKKENAQINKNICLECGNIIKNRVNMYTIENMRPYCEKCFDKWSDNNPIGG